MVCCLLAGRKWAERRRRRGRRLGSKLAARTSSDIATTVRVNGCLQRTIRAADKKNTTCEADVWMKACLTLMAGLLYLQIGSWWGLHDSNHQMLIRLS